MSNNATHHRLHMYINKRSNTKCVEWAEESDYKMTKYEILLSIIIGSIISLLLIIMVSTVQIQAKQMPRVATKLEKMVMKYHGTEVLMEGYDGKMYFIRNGEKIKVKI